VPPTATRSCERHTNSEALTVAESRACSGQVLGRLPANLAEVLRDAAITGRGITLAPTFIAGTYQAALLALYELYPPTRHLAVSFSIFW